jgi:long-chain acyl-CoA synthetase
MQGKPMGQVLRDVIALDPERVALVINGEATTYAALQGAIEKAAGCLREAGVTPGMRLPLVDDASLVSVAGVIGATYVGASTALMNPRLTGPELEVLMAAANTADLGVVGPAFAATALSAGIRPAIDPLVLREDGAGGALVPPNVPGDDEDAVILFTSGTTGTPKAVPLTHGMVAPRITAFAPEVDLVPAVSIMCVPLVHIGGMLGLLVALARGSTTVVQTRFDAGEWLALAERHRVTTAFLVPTMLFRILEHPSFASTDLSALTSLSYGAAPATPELVRRTMEVLPGVALTNTFGQTETMGSITALGPGDHPPERLASVGQPLPGVTIRIVDLSSGQDVAPGEVGELWVRSEVAVVPSASTDGVDAPPGWFRTGDLVSADKEGYLFPAGRLSDTINRGGEKFAPSEVEEAVRRHPAVRDVAAVGVPDPEMGHRVGVAIVVRQPLELDDLRALCRQHIANFKIPEVMLIVNELPYTDFGKVDRKILRSRLADASADKANG